METYWYGMIVRQVKKLKAQEHIQKVIYLKIKIEILINLVNNLIFNY